MRAVLIYAATVLSILATNSNLVLGQTAPGDFDGDATITLEDHRALTDCLTGPGTTPLGERCAIGDFDCDGDVDLRDWRWMQNAFDGAPPLPAGCCESSADELLSAVASNPVASAAFHDSWRLATELGFAPTLYSLIRCELPDGRYSYTASLGSLNKNGAISLVAATDALDAWAPILFSPQPDAVQIIDRSGGLLVLGLSSKSPTVIELDANGFPVATATGAESSPLPQGPSSCEFYKWACFREQGQHLLTEHISFVYLDLTVSTLCVAAGGPVVVRVVCAAAGMQLLSLHATLTIYGLLLAEPNCIEKTVRGDFRCDDQGCTCSSYGTCQNEGGLLVCKGRGDRCQDSEGQDLRCRVDAIQPEGYQCVHSVCGDGITDPLIGEECDIIEAPHDGCGVALLSHPVLSGPCLIAYPGISGQLYNCVNARCGDGFRCMDPGCTSCPNGGQEECDDGNNVGGDGCAADCHREECGNGILDLGEECDGTDDAACPGSCLPGGAGLAGECTCNATCPTFIWKCCVGSLTGEPPENCGEVKLPPVIHACAGPWPTHDGRCGVGDGCPPIAWCCFSDDYCTAHGSSQPPSEIPDIEQYCRDGRLMVDLYGNRVLGNFVLGPCP